MTKVELHGWPAEASTSQDRPWKGLSPFQQKERIAILLRQSQGATINELMTFTKCTAAQARGYIRQLIDDGGDLTVAPRAEDGQQVFFLKN
ncbi:hypothetical protein [Loktanella sp. Alg231-35]|uniref:hypothetical protein n=1 Tax=Loktanella sp. Alg231-35 TaxID=1922220 RepID=UPI000D557707|nr:hypothetical protein [Loktanella sp. Alg231-35]